MAESFQTQIDKVRSSIANLEAQRNILGDDTVNTALTALQNQLSILEAQAAAIAPAVDERRMVTILFIDIVGSTSIAEKLDPEEWRQILSQVHAALGNAVTSHHGTIAQYLGDGILAFFGSKQASEHDPENAIRAALEGNAAVANLGIPQKIETRTGIHTGLVVVGDLGDAIHKEYTASGDAMNLAARLQSAAPAGGILISHDTYRYVRGVFDLTPNPPLSVKGKSETVQTYLVRRAKPRPFRSVTRGVAGIETRTIGREAEMQTLQSAYLHAFEHHAVVWMQLLGDPGVGKSRLLEDLTDWLDLRDETFRLLRGRAFPDDANQPFALVRRLWFDRFQIAEDAPLEQAETKWVARFKEFSGLDDEEATHALGLLVGLSFQDSPYMKGMRNDPNQVKGRALVVSRDLINAIRRNYPVVVLLEDLQWADQASWEYLTEVFLNNAEAEQSHGLFILGVARPEWNPPPELLHQLNSLPLGNNEPEKLVSLINLAPLSDQSTRELSRELFQRVADVPESVIELLVQRSEGVPYYTEEIVNWFIDHDIIETHAMQWYFCPERLKDQPLPATLQHLLLTRLSSLTTNERAALQRGSIFGRRFWTGGVEALGVPAGDETLGHLQPRGFVDSQPDSSFQGDTEWSFHHNLLQEVTYESVLKRERAALHKVAAEWLESQARQAGRLDEFAGLLGDHFERAGELNAAADWYILAGRRAMIQGAPRQANEFFAHALELLPPIDRDRRWQTLLGSEEALSVLGDAEPWKESTEAVVELAHSFEDGNYLAEAYLRQAICKQRSGSTPIDEQAAAMQAALSAAQRCGNEAIQAEAFALLAQTENIRGNQPASEEYVEKSLGLARRLGNESVLSFVLFRAAFASSGNYDRIIKLYSEQIDLDHRLGNRQGEANGLGNLGAAYNALGLHKHARPIIERARKINEALSARRSLAYDLVGQAIIYKSAGDLRNAYLLMEQAYREISPSQDVRGRIGVLYSLGGILLDMGDVPNAFIRFSESRELALRTGMAARVCMAEAGLAQCAIQQGHLDDARRYAHSAWDYYKEHGWHAMTNPSNFLRRLAESFDALGETDNYRAILESAHDTIMEVAEKITVPEWRQSFLNNNLDNRALVEMWERIGLE